MSQDAESHNPYAPPQSGLYEPPLVAHDDLPADNFRPFLTIWTRPRQTVRRIVATNPDLHVTLLTCLAGISSALDRSAERSNGDEVPLAVILLIICLIGPLGGLFTLWLFSHLIRWTGSWIGGIAPRMDIRTAVAWSNVPTVFGLPLWLPLLAIFGGEIFGKGMPSLLANPVLWIPLIAIGFLQVVLGVWSFVVLCNTVAEVQGFRSAWRGFLNLFLSGMVIFIPVILIVIVAVVTIRR